VTAYKEHSNELLSIICWGGSDFKIQPHWQKRLLFCHSRYLTLGKIP